MKRDWITYGVIAFALGALVMLLTPDLSAEQRAARDSGEMTDIGADGDQGVDWSDWLGGLLMLLGVGLALAGIFRDDTQRVGYEPSAKGRNK